MKYFVVATLLFIFLSACGGGGGGGSDRGSVPVSDKTGIRLLHASLDSIPLTIVIDGQEIQRAGYAETTTFVPVSPGVHRIHVRGLGQGGVAYSDLTQEFAQDREYELVVYGREIKGDMKVKLESTLIKKPESGKGFIRVYNTYSGAGTLSVNIGGENHSVAYGQSSPFVSVPEGTASVNVSFSSGNTSVAVQVEGGLESTVVVSGATDIGFMVTPSYLDRD